MFFLLPKKPLGGMQTPARAGVGSLMTLLDEPDSANLHQVLRPEPGQKLPHPARIPPCINFSRWGGRSFLSPLRLFFSQNKPQKLPRTGAQANSEPTTCARFRPPTPVCIGSQSKQQVCQGQAWLVPNRDHRGLGRRGKAERRKGKGGGQNAETLKG